MISSEELLRTANVISEVYRDSSGNTSSTTMMIISLALTSYTPDKFPQNFLEDCFKSSRVIKDMLLQATEENEVEASKTSTERNLVDETAGMSEEELREYLQKEGAGLLASLGIDSMGKA